MGSIGLYFNIRS